MVSSLVTFSNFPLTPQTLTAFLHMNVIDSFKMNVTFAKTWQQILE